VPLHGDRGLRVTGAESLQKLLAGNERFAGGRGRARRHRPELASGQAPIAAVLACADSRVSPEVVLDQDLGDVFAVRVAGNTADEPVVLGSIEYAVDVLGVPLVLVLGHDGCGAVAAAIESVGGAPPARGHVPALVTPIVEVARATGAGAPADGALLAAVRENVRRQAARLAASGAVLAPAMAAGRLVVAGACYSPADGTVEVLTPTASR
jgi:carbonic anhydrase